MHRKKRVRKKFLLQCTAGEETVLEALSAVAASAPSAGWERTDLHRVVLCCCPAPPCPPSSSARGGQRHGSLHRWHTPCTLANRAPTLLLCNEITLPGPSKIGIESLGPSVHVSSKFTLFHFLVIRAKLCQFIFTRAACIQLSW